MVELRRRLGLFEVTMYGVGLILGAGIYVLIGGAAALAGNLTWASFLLGAAIATFTGLSYAELASMFPKAAAEYVYVNNAFKLRFPAFIVGWIIVFASISSVSTISIGFGGYFAGLFSSTSLISALVLIVLLTLISLYGIRESIWFNVVFTLIEVTGLGIIIFVGIIFPSGNPVDFFESPSGINGIFAAVPLIFFAYIGFEHIANMSEETRNPRRTIPRALLLSILITTVLYVLVAISAVRVLDWRDLAGSSTPLAAVAGSALGPSGSILLTIIALFATTNTVLIALIASSRILYGMASHGSLPSFFSTVSKRTRTPWVAILAVMSVALIFTALGNLVTVAEITVFSIVITFAAVNLSLIWLRYREPNFTRPFKVPFNIGRFPVLPSVGLLTSLVGVTQFDANIIVIGLSAIGVGVLFYLIFRKFR